MNREAALRLLAKHRTNEFVVRGWTEWDHIDPSERNFIGVRAMGHHGGFALGLALARPDHTFICFEGDGGILMNLGILVTIANANPRNLIVIILNNGAYEITTLQGENTVNVSGPAITKEPQLGYAPKRIDVTSGDNKLDIELPPK